ncbi:CheR family methyltransferase [Pelagicoccus albus]|uniref:protein-glutamate O-methyltransferase n=1 Tax=Pelagicoccus albus TaxID=415222 RepID=A0A7X1B8R0_9BACT|nr:CheR family methyltransferase [Pelagicoccus albus]MBC2606435.1 chemotaxis protein CheR [Pelagicoccus albus]
MRLTNATREGLSSSSFQTFAEVIQRELGIKMPSGKVNMLRSRLQRRLRQLGLDSFEEYEELLLDSPQATEEFVHFTDAVTTNKTEFFRESAHFDYLTENCLPELDRNRNIPWHFKLWCAGCSSGEEPYSLSMVLNEYASFRPGFDHSILGTDISSQVLENSKRAIYHHDRIGPIPENFRKKYLLRGKDTSLGLFRIAPNARTKVSFSSLNFMRDSYPIRETFDIVFFRNVLIYFDRPTQEAVVNKICEHLRPGGYLFISHSESLNGLDVPLNLVGSSVFKKW